LEQVGYVNLREKNEKAAGEGGTRRGRIFVLALRSTPVTNPMLSLCDNQALLKAVERWVGEGGKATLKERRRVGT